MEEKKLSDLTDQELLQEAKKMKSKAITNAVLIGFLVGIILYSVIPNTLGFLTLIPLFLAYKLINNSKYKTVELENILKERNLKWITLPALFRVSTKQLPAYRMYSLNTH